ncbi:hypothetical protein ACJX0J_016049 [Zea mays]
MDILTTVEANVFGTLALLDWVVSNNYDVKIVLRVSSAPEMDDVISTDQRAKVWDYVDSELAHVFDPPSTSLAQRFHLESVKIQSFISLETFSLKVNLTFFGRLVPTTLQPILCCRSHHVWECRRPYIIFDILYLLVLTFLYMFYLEGYIGKH